MKSLILKGTVAAAGLLSLAGVAAAQVETATATADLNLRSGPGPEYPVVDVIRASEEVVINGCEEGGGWCSINHAGVEGWAYSGYLATGYDSGAGTIIAERPPEAVPLTTYERSVTGSIAVETVPPPPEVITYVERNRVEPVYLEGELSIGVGLPEAIDVYEIPGYEYHYVYVNGQPVLVEPETRRVVYVMP
ncbi:DUF1236 domain-containing protein [Chelativorans xinjiangense]|uniref:DUF1236 domain-containing protein n=1 Tax=Chelativorans xinjiangense TaxID=2681485 RepID=UPI001359317C|nr:DUF1236 domain-containing protein [Chelativorans xinjiangense]